jgi:hypothetical protein
MLSKNKNKAKQSKASLLPSILYIIPHSSCATHLRAMIYTAISVECNTYENYIFFFHIFIFVSKIWQNPPPPPPPKKRDKLVDFKKKKQ